MKKHILLLLSGLLSATLSGQSLLQDEKNPLSVAPLSSMDESYAIPWTPTDASVLPAPEAVWRNRYVSHPVSHSTGTVQVNIPLCSLPVKDIPLDVSLSYHTGGIKADDVASPAGLGWSLQAGGSISRVVNGQPDELIPFKIQTRSKVVQNADLQYLKDLQHYDKEGNYDRYYYHFDGHSGSFICDPSDGGITQLPPTPNVITRVKNTDGSFDFTIRTLSGATYYFTEREHSTYEFLPTVLTAYYRSPDYRNVPTGWHLTRIVSPQGRDEVTLSYKLIPQWQRSRTERNSSSFFEMDDRGTATWNSNEYGSSLSASHRTTFPDQLVLSRITSARFGTLEFTSSPITGGAATGQPDIRMASILQKDCAGNVVRTVTFDNDRKDLDGKLTLRGVTVTDNGKLSDKRTFTYYSGRGVGEGSKDLFGYSNAGLTGITGESVLDTKAEIAANRCHHFDSAVGGALKSITEATGAVTTYTYESNTCDSFKTPVSIGLRVKQIETSDPVSGKNRKRTFIYEKPHCSIDFDGMKANAFISVSGCVRGVIGTPMRTYYSSSAVLTSSCRIPGFRPENAVIYYGKVTEDLSGTADTDVIRTVYEYDTSDCEHPFVPVAGGSKPGMTLAPERYLGEKLDCSNLFQDVALRRKLFSAQSAGGYFRETAWEKAPLTRKVVYRKTATGFEPAEEEVNTYELYRNSPFSTGFHSESLVRTKDAGGIEKEDFQSVDDFHYYELTSVTGSRYKTGTKHISYYADGSSREVQKEYKYDHFARLVIPSARTLGDGVLPPVVFPDFPGFGQEAQYASTQQPVAVITRCGGHSFAHYLCYASNVSRAPYNAMAQSGLRDLPAMERWVADETDTLTLNYEYVKASDGKYNLSRKTLVNNGEEVSVHDFTRYDGYGNLLEESVNRLPSTAYVYGYKHALPVAVIKGEGYGSIDSSTLQQLEAQSGLASFSTTLRNLLEGIRKRESSLTEIYEYRPATGISRHTAPNGASHTYGYDGRLLKNVVDFDGKSVYEYSYGLKAEGGDNFMTTREYLHGTKDYRERTEVYDGLGLPYFLREKGVTPAGKDLLSLKEYDNQMRESKSWIPAPGTTTDAQGFPALSKQFHGDANAFLSNVYEPAENGRLVALQQPGSDMAGKRMTMVYSSNSTNKSALTCRRYSVSSAGLLSSNGLYSSGELEVRAVTDEDGHTTYTFTDFTGRVVLTRGMNGSEPADTYYVYDSFGKLGFVLMPEATALHANGSWDIASNDVLRRHAYHYRYDGKCRLVERKLPGRDPVYTRYDRSGAPVFTQDGNQRARGVWEFHVADRHGRPALRGECPAASLPDIGGAVVSCTFNAAKAGLGNSRYEVSGMSLSNATLKQALYYDGYGFLGMPGFTDRTIYPQGTVSAKGHLTGSVDWIEGDSGALHSAFYYDLKGRVTKRVQGNIAGGHDVKETAYTFTGKPATVKHAHTAAGKPALSEEYKYIYDAEERLSTVEHTLGDATVTLLSNTYDELGRLESKSPHGSASNKQTYAYNIRGWLTGISGSRFTQHLYYNTGHGTACHNGDISSMTWKSGTESTVRGYKFTYDGLDRLLDATYGETESIGTNVNRFSERVTGYDKNGNVKGLQRYGQTGASSYGLVDNLTYTLDGNQLSRVDDAVAASAYNGGFEFKDGVKQANEYAYDANGNLTKDLNKGISNISYNCLNLPSTVTFSDGSSISYTYGADGTKLKTVHKTGSTTTTTDYCGNVVYENGVRKLLLTDEGYVTLSDGKYHYYLKDHQGNNRVVINQSGTVEETNHYYPFGGVFASSGNVQPYKYNGKELDAKKGLNWYDYGARHYDAALGRFTTNDRFAEKYHSMSPYQYGANNPVKNVDVNGDSIVVLNYTSGEHLGLLIQNSSNRWEYYSFNGDKIYNSTEGSLGGGPQDNKGELSWPTPQAFLDSEYNQNTSKEDLESGKVNGYGYQEGYLIPTTEKQDRIIKNTFLETVDQGYSLIKNQCSMAVQKALNAAGIKTKVSYNYSPMGAPAMYSSPAQYNPYLPSMAYRIIIKNNPNGIYIKRR